MSLLPPTVGERLARCCTSVWVIGVMPGSEVELRRRLDGETDVQTMTSTGTETLFQLDSPLEARERIAARQQTGSDGSEWGNEVEVEDVALPPAPPRMEPSIPRCGRCALANGSPPGSTVELIRDGYVIGEGVINRHGWTCLKIKEMPRSQYMSARAITCELGSPPTGNIEVDADRSHLLPPLIIEPVFGCQTVISLDRLVPGAVAELFADDVSLGTVCSCWNRVNVHVGRALVNGQKITAIQRMNPAEWDCTLESIESDPVEVIPPDGRIKPQILSPLHEGDNIIHVANQIEGGTITLYVRSPGEVEENIGSRPATEYPEIPVPETAPLRAGRIIRAKQELCGQQDFSDPVTVLAQPGHIDPPTVRAPLYDCSVVMAVDDVVPGAVVYALQDGIPIGHAWSPGESVILNHVTALREGAQVTAYQVASGLRSSQSSPVTVDAWEDRLPRPIVLPPIRPGDTFVWVTDIIPGAYVRLFDAGVQIGGGHAVDPAAAIPVWWPIGENAIITARQSLCLRESDESAPRPAVSEPCEGPPRYEPSLWNDDPNIQWHNNCYNYACDMILFNNKSQPGRASGDYPNPMACEDITNAALSDGLQRCTGSCHPCHHRVALFVDPGYDYHWYRQDDNGRWSHKPGRALARNVDSSDNLITNPETADRRVFNERGDVVADYTDFCGYFCVNKNEVVIQ